MAKVVMYCTAVCPYCVSAERLLKSRGVTDIEKIRIDLDPAKQDEMISRSGRRTVPQVFIGDTLRFEGSDCVLRVTAPREPCGKFVAVMGLKDGARTMVREARCGFYLAVDAPGALQSGMAVQLTAARQRTYSIPDAIRAKWAKHRNG